MDLCSIVQMRTKRRKEEGTREESNRVNTVGSHSLSSFDSRRVLLMKHNLYRDVFFPPLHGCDKEKNGNVLCRLLHRLVFLFLSLLVSGSNFVRIYVALNKCLFAKQREKK